MKLKATKCDLKCWNEKVFGNYHTKVEINNHKLHYIDSKLTGSPKCNSLNSWHFQLVRETYAFQPTLLGQIC